jgi:hypothetical protein
MTIFVAEDDKHFQCRFRIGQAARLEVAFADCSPKYDSLRAALAGRETPTQPR